ncbi:MAG: tetratricopeptide repeat protein [Deltaproteobacteria bacterium]|nr:tetratricopeptide repeat protein [Deltaproteobacteria bacterium]
MAVSSHRRVSRKTLRQPDEFVSTVDLIGDWIARNLTRLIVGAAVLIAIIVAVVVFSIYSQHRQRVVSEQFYSAINALSDKDYGTAEKSFSKLAQHRSGSSLGQLAEFYLANTYIAQNQPSKARNALQSYLAGGGNRLFRQMALVQLGVSNENLGEYRNAHAAYLHAAQLDGPEKARAQIGAARTLARLGDRQGAIAAYQQFLRENPFSQQSVEITEALAQMGAPPEHSSKGSLQTH